MSADDYPGSGCSSPVIEDLTPDDVFDRVDEALKEGSYVDPDVLRDLLLLLNEIRVDPKASKTHREKASFFIKKIEDRFANVTNESYATSVKEVRTLAFAKGNLDAVEKVDIHGLLEEREVCIDKNRILGSGSFGTVYAGTKDGLPVAVKVLNKDTTDEDKIAFRNEAEILARIRHPYCCEFVGYMMNPFRIVTRRYPTDLYHLIASGTLTVTDRLRIAYQLACAVCYIHSIGLIHRDLKSENVFIDENGNVRLADFGLTQYAPDTVRDDGSPPGSLLFMSPEQILGKPFTQKGEVFTLGIVLWELFTGRFPFDDVETQEELIERQKATPMLPVNPSDYSTKHGDGKPPKEIFDLASKCYAYYPELRPELPQVMKDIMDIGVRYVVTKSNTAEMFWKAICCYTYRPHVLLPEFVSYMKVEKRQPIVTTLKDAVSPNWNLMDIQHYWNLCCWFPNFFRSSRAYALMEDIVYSPWYCCDEAQADRRLHITTTDGFVIRPSTTDPFPSPFTLCVKIADKIRYYHIIRHNRSRCVTFSCELAGEDEFASLRMLAKFIENNLHIPVAKKLTSLDGVYGNRM